MKVLRIPTWVFLMLPLMSLAQPQVPAVVYEVFVQAFADGNGDGIGDLPGLTEKLDYIAELGAEAIWLMPIHPSPSYHKYDVADYRGIHPDYGSMADFEAMLDKAHQLGLQVILDLVINHSSDQHPWFQAARQGPDNPFRQYYVWADYDSIKAEIHKKTVTLDSDNLTQWHAVEGQTERYYGFFWTGMPDLNWDHAPLREAVYDIARFWLDKGVDGFRLDAARHIYPDDRPTDNHRMWEAFRAELQQVKPDVYLVGEVYADPEVVTPYLKGLPALFNFGLAKAIIEALQTGHTSNLIETHRKIQAAYQAVNPDFVDATILSNHDQNRIMSVLGNDPHKARLAAALLFSLPGTPYLYYGEELGMRGVKPDEHIREPFPWDMPGNDRLQSNWIPPQHNTPEQVDPLSQQQADPLSLYWHYRRWIALRRHSPTLRAGSLRPTEWQVEGVVSFYREQEGHRLLVVHNLTGQPISLPSWSELDVPLLSGGPKKLTDPLGPYESQVWGTAADRRE